MAFTYPKTVSTYSKIVSGFAIVLGLLAIAGMTLFLIGMHEYASHSQIFQQFINAKIDQTAYNFAYSSRNFVNEVVSNLFQGTNLVLEKRATVSPLDSSKYPFNYPQEMINNYATLVDANY